MKLSNGLRLEAGPRNVYEIVGEAWTGPRHAFLRAKKLYWNFRYPAPTLDEADREECLDVLVRAPLDSNERQDRPDPGFERERVLSLAAQPWFLELLDVLDPTGSAPLLILTDPHALRGSIGPPPDPTTARQVVRMLTESLMMLDSLHREGLVAKGLDPGDFLLDQSGHWYYLGTDRIQPASSHATPQADLVHWATCVERMRGGPEPRFVPEPSGSAARDESEWLYERARLCLTAAPASVAELWRGPTPARGPLALLRKAFGRHPGGS